MGKQTMEQAKRAAVKDYLQQYHNAKEQKRRLERRHRALTRELEDPGPGSTYRTMPTAKDKKTDGAASVVYRVAEVEARIDRQRQEMTKAVLNIMDMADLLELHTTTRQVIELRHIDCRGWDEISREVHLSRSSVFSYYNTGLKIIAENKRAQKLIQKYSQEKNRRSNTENEKSKQ